MVFLLLAGIPVGLLGWRAVAAREARTAGRDELPILGHVSEFELTERSDLSLRRSDLDGKVWVADFIFTNCAGPCPLMSAKMAELQRATAGVSGVALVSFSVDPERDTPPVLREYADRYGADPDRWLFLTGEVSTIHKLAIEGFKIGDMKDPLLHSNRFVLVDVKGRIRGYYDSDEPDVVQRLADDVRSLRGLDR